MTGSHCRSKAGMEARGTTTTSRHLVFSKTPSLVLGWLMLIFKFMHKLGVAGKIRLPQMSLVLLKKVNLEEKFNLHA